MRRSPASATRRLVDCRRRGPPSRAASAASRSSPGQRRAVRGTPPPVRRGSAISRRAAPVAAALARAPAPPPRPARKQTRHAALTRLESLPPARYRYAHSGSPSRPVLFNRISCPCCDITNHPFLPGKHQVIVMSYSPPFEPIRRRAGTSRAHRRRLSRGPGISSWTPKGRSSARSTLAATASSLDGAVSPIDRKPTVLA
jgi:hypothetical protein